jgi:hypothetical protein
VELQPNRTPTPHKWADMGSAAELADLYCPAGVAGSAVLLRPAEEVELTDLQRLAEEAGRADSQRSAEEAGLAGSVVVAESLVGQSWTPQLPCCILEGILD